MNTRPSVALLPPEHREKYIQASVKVLAYGPYTGRPCDYTFEIKSNGNVRVHDLHHPEPQRLAQWVSDLVEIAQVVYEPLDAIELANGLQQMLTTEQGDLTTLIMAQAAFGSLRHG